MPPARRGRRPSDPPGHGRTRAYGTCGTKTTTTRRSGGYFCTCSPVSSCASVFCGGRSDAVATGRRAWRTRLRSLAPSCVLRHPACAYGSDGPSTHQQCFAWADAALAPVMLETAPMRTPSPLAVLICFITSLFLGVKEEEQPSC
jgi:hypothetical protein